MAMYLCNFGAWFNCGGECGCLVLLALLLLPRFSFKALYLFKSQQSVLF